MSPPPKQELTWYALERSNTYLTTPAPDPTAETKKLVISKDIFSLFTWHLSAIISCLVTGVILYLNFSEYSIGTEIGRDKQGTRNILGALQLAAKAHEILMVISLGRIARQWIQHFLINDGLLLGLVGAESSMSNLALLVSREFRATISHTVTILLDQPKGQFTQTQRQQAKALILLLGTLSIGCLLCSLAGPASAVLMIPRYDWFHNIDIFNGSEYYTSTDNSRFLRMLQYLEISAYPNIFIAPELGKNGPGTDVSDSWSIPGYWDAALFSREPKTPTSFEYNSGTVPVRIDVNTSLNRELVAGASWNGATKLTGVMLMDTTRNNLRLSGYESVPKNRGSESKYIAEVTGIEVNTVCRRRQKQTCSNVDSDIRDSSEWCFLSVMENPSGGLLLSSKDLLLVNGAKNSTEIRIWITGGRIASRNMVSDSVIVVMEVLGTKSFNSSLIVCSISAMFKSATASSTTQLFSPDNLDFHEHISYFNGNSTAYDPPRKLLYYDSWFESTHGRGSKTSDPCHYTPNKAYSCRGQLEQTTNTLLTRWGKMIARAGGYNGVPVWWKQEGGAIGAETAEIIIGGTFLSMFLYTFPSTSQYGDPFNVGQLEFPEELMIEPARDYTQYFAPPVKIYYLIYGFKLSSRTSIFSVVVLLLHAVFVLVGSLWEFWKGSLIQAWGSMPEYVMLCLGSDAAYGVENTCVGIGQNETLNKIVRIREVTEAHLELVVLSPNTELLGSVVDPEKKYGFLGEKRRRVN